MSFRTVVISHSSKISYKNRFLVVKRDLDEKYIHLSEIDTVIIDSISVSISAYLLKELSQNKINIIFCDESHNPFGELMPFYVAHNSSKKIMLQSSWKQEQKDLLWKNIVKNKIMNQMLLLKKIKSKNSDLLLSYISEVQPADKTNREAHAAKVYFNSLFGKSFIRNNDDEINAALNYGYSVLLSTINKEIIANGYITQLGINHKSEYNEFNLGCDFMESFRILIDNFVYHNQKRKFDYDYKMDLVNILNQRYNFDGKNYTLKDIIKNYVKNNLQFMNNEQQYKDFVIYEG